MHHALFRLSSVWYLIGRLSMMLFQSEMEAPFPESKKSWEEGEPDAWTLVPDHLDRRLGEHSMPIEDPFSLNHDLSRVLRPSGYLTIREEVLKAWVGMLNGAPWAELSKKEATTEIQQFDLFEDLRNLPMDRINALHQETIDQLTRAEGRWSKVEFSTPLHRPSHPICIRKAGYAARGGNRG
jgi:hypothetical protein